MIEVQNISNEAHQRHIIAFQSNEITLQLRYASIAACWLMTVEYKSWRIDNVKLSCGSLHMRQENKPFDFIVTDNSPAGLDPFQLNDFIDGRCSLYMLEADDMTDIRGVAVPL